MESQAMYFTILGSLPQSLRSDPLEDSACAVLPRVTDFRNLSPPRGPGWAGWEGTPGAAAPRRAAPFLDVVL